MKPPTAEDIIKLLEQNITEREAAAAASETLRTAVSDAFQRGITEGYRRFLRTVRLAASLDKTPRATTPEGQAALDRVDASIVSAGASLRDELARIPNPIPNHPESRNGGET